MDRTNSEDLFSATNPTLLLLQLISLLAIVLLLIRKFKNRHFDKLASIFPGPTPLPVIGNALELRRFDYDIIAGLKNFKDRYKTPVKFYMGPELWIFLAKPEDLQIVLNSPNSIEKPKFYKFYNAFIGTGLLTAPADIWKKNRKMMAPAFYSNVLEQFLPIFNERASDLVRKLEPNSRNGEEFDVWPYIISVAVTTIFQTALGANIAHDKVWLEKFDQMVQRGWKLTKSRAVRQWLHPQFVYDQLSEAKELKKMASVVQKKLEEVLRMKKEEFSEKRQRSSTTNKFEDTQTGSKYSKGPQQSGIFIDILLEQGIANSFTDKDLMDEIALMIMAGSDTCAITISFCLLLLAINQDVQEKVFEEQMSIFHEVDRPVSNDDLRKMVYTEQVIKEILRLYPSGPVLARSVTEDIKISGDNVIPSGATVIISPFLTHRDSEIWPDADEFNPENFSADNVMKRHRYAFISFSGGPRGFLGSKYAMISLKTTVSIISRQYKVTTTMNKEDVKPEMVVLLRSSNGYNISLKPRTASNWS